MKRPWRLLISSVLLSLLAACGDKGKGGPPAETSDQQKAIAAKYAAIQAGASKRSLTMGTAFNNSPESNDPNFSLMAPYTSALNNGRVVGKNTVWLDDKTSVDYVAFSFLSDDFLNTQVVKPDKAVATTQVWRHYNNKWCPILAFREDNQTPLLSFSVSAAAPWITTSNGQVTYRLFVGTAQGFVGKVSFLDTDPASQTCSTSIESADNESSHVIFYNGRLNFPTYGTPINGMKMASFVENTTNTNGVPQSPVMSDKRILYWWGNTSDCKDDKCSDWRASPAMAMLLENGKMSGSYNPRAEFDGILDQDAVANGNRVIKTKVGDVDLRVKYDRSTRHVKMDWAIAYQTLPTDKLNQPFGLVPNITTRSYEYGITTSIDIINGIAGLGGNREGYSQHVGTISERSGDFTYYLPTSKVKIFDLNNDPNTTYVSVTTLGVDNPTGMCPIIGVAADCKGVGWYPLADLSVSYSPASAARLEVADAIKAYGYSLENIAFTAKRIEPMADTQGAREYGDGTRGVAIRTIGENMGDLDRSKTYLRFPDSKFVTQVPYDTARDNKTLLTSPSINLGQMRAVLLPDAGSDDPQLARLFIILPVIDNFLYNPPVAGSSKANTRGGLLMCTGSINLKQYAGRKIPITAAMLLSNLDCSQEWQQGRRTGFKYAAAEDIVLNGTYETSIAGMDIAVSPAGQINLSYISNAGALLNLNITDAAQAWVGQTAWTEISQGRAASCKNELYKPLPEKEPTFWTKVLTKIPFAGMFAGESFLAALSDFLVDVVEVGGDVGCEAAGAGPGAPICGVLAGKVADLALDAVHAPRGDDKNPYKEAYENTRELTKCIGG
jgi:hypothetical protein